MFVAALMRGEDVPAQRMLGAGIAVAGLAWLLWPNEALTLPISAVILMAAAGIGWGVYSLAGQGAQDATQSTAMNFILAAPFGVLAMFLLPQWEGFTATGIALAIVSGAVTSGLGYALWYAIIPALGASRAAVAQLTVPVIAMGGGMVFLAEDLSLRFVICSVLVLGGVALSIKKG
jgi:drug/metabolite transporter (DMT)-like permease